MTSGAAPSRPSRYDAVAAFLFLASFLQALDNHLVPPLLPDLASVFGGDAAGRLLTAYALGAAVIPFVVAARLRRSARRVLAPALFAHGAASLAFVWAARSGDGLLASLARAAAGAASGVLSFALLAVAAETAGPRRNFRIASQTAGFVSALVLGLPLGARVAEAASPAAPFLGASGLALLLTFAAVAVARRPEASGAAAAQAATPLSRLWRGRTACAGLLAALVTGAAVGMPTSRLGVHLRETGGLDASDLGDTYLWAGVAPVLAMPFAAALLRRCGAFAVCAGASALFVLPTLWIARDDAATKAAAATALFFALLFETVRRTGLQGLLADAVQPIDRPRFLALRGLVAQLGLAAGYAAAQPLHARRGFAAVCVVSSVLSIAGAGAAWGARPRAGGGG